MIVREFGEGRVAMWCLGSLFFALFFALSLVGGHAGAEELPGDPQAGAEVARGICASCHVVADDQMIDPGVGPSFFEVAEHPGTTALSLRAFLQTPHATMPNLMLTPQETDDLISYLLMLKGE
jgi:mono/diheme cytochrome c family protein